MGILIRWVVAIIAVFLAQYIVNAILPGSITYTDWTGLAIFAAVLGIVNAVVKPIVSLFAFPFVIMTLGLVLIVINALMFMLAAAISPGFQVNGFLAALLGSIAVSLVSWVLSIVLPN
ncbi:MAG TPA: phage holin family protein [Chloroflexia bacterium]|nr:phage holin family protein [Chloroflexia bacterium]